MSFGEPVQILLVDDSPTDVILTQEALEESKIRNQVSVVSDGIEALKYLRQEDPYGGVVRPDLIFLDLNMPRMSGRELLVKIKNDDALKAIPVVILTTSQAEQDIFDSYNLHANCYITKPVDLRQFTTVVHSVQNFWFAIVKLPPGGERP
jgi:CheY-like chemotaxis protein